MALLSWLFGKKTAEKQTDTKLSPPSSSASQAPKPRLAAGAQVKWREGSFPTEVVGESNYQTALSAICGPHTRDGYNREFLALIALEPSNPYDANAVVVTIEDQVVGYLPREQAVRVGSQMREEGLSNAICTAQVRGGWRTNQYDEGHFGVRLAIPQRGWIDFGTGRRPSIPPQQMSREATIKSERPEPADSGPLRGQWVAIIGAPSDGDLARELAAQGARIMAGVGKSTTMLVVAQDRPFTPGLLESSQYRKAEKRISEGASLRILSHSEVRQLMAQ